jgi:hypothetical protein
VLLAVLSLYNPFLTVSGTCDVLHVHHPPSFRATIASSELRRCTLDEDKILIPAPEALETDPNAGPVVGHRSFSRPARS